MAKLIAICGPDKVGKETQSKMLTAYLRSNGFKVAHFEIPYNDYFTHKIIYWMLRNGLAKTYPGLFQLIQFMNKRIFERFVLSKVEHENDYVILDRWSLSALIYGLATGVNKQSCRDQFQKLKTPDATIVLMGKAMSDKKDDSYEADNYIQRRVRELYTDWAEDNKALGCALIHASGNRGEVHYAIIDSLKDMGVL